MSRKVLIALQSFAEYSTLPLTLLQNAGVDLIVNKLRHRLNQTEIIELGRACEGIIAGVEPYDENVLHNLDQLKCISRCGVGVDNIALDIAKRKNIAVLNTPEVVVQPVAEMTVALVFDLLKLLTFHTGLLRSGKWQKKAGHLLNDRKVGVVGLGRIGRRVAEIFKALNAQVYGFDLYPDQAWAKKTGIKILPLPELLKTVDVLCLHVSLSKDNPFKLGQAEIASLPKGAIVINTSRGQVLDEGALCQALTAGHLGGVGMDVFSKEPYTGPLLNFDNVVLTPHISTLTEESRVEMEVQAVKNLLKYFNLPVTA
jgi:D-3-phosphoglycerate dehydrogenase